VSSFTALFSRNNCQMLRAEKLAPQFDLLTISTSVISVQLDDFSKQSMRVLSCECSISQFQSSAMNIDNLVNESGISERNYVSCA
jgi:hypothetical protein